MDIANWPFEQGVPKADPVKNPELPPSQSSFIYKEIVAKRQAKPSLKARLALIESVTAITNFG